MKTVASLAHNLNNCSHFLMLTFILWYVIEMFRFKEYKKDRYLSIQI